jgi:hypothetical protein
MTNTSKPGPQKAEQQVGLDDPLLDPSTPQSVVDAELRLLGVDPERLARRGAEFARSAQAEQPASAADVDSCIECGATLDECAREVCSEECLAANTRPGRDVLTAEERSALRRELGHWGTGQTRNLVASTLDRLASELAKERAKVGAMRLTEGESYALGEAIGLFADSAEVYAETLRALRDRLDGKVP